MKVLQCDRCRRVSPPDGAKTWTTIQNVTDGDLFGSLLKGPRDICDECSHDFKAWWSSPARQAFPKEPVMRDVPREGPS